MGDNKVVSLKPRNESNRGFDNEDYADQLVYLLIHDKESLDICTHNGLNVHDFRPVKGARDADARWMIAERALEYYTKHDEPIGDLIRADVLKYCENLNLGTMKVNAYKTYIDNLETIKRASRSAILDGVVEFRRAINNKTAIIELTNLQVAGQLTNEKWEEISQRVLAGWTPKDKVIADLPQWPDPLKEEALSGLPGDIVRAIEPVCEADPAALLVQTLVLFGNLVGRGPHWLHGATRHALNLFAGIVGTTGSGKGSGLDQVTNIFDDVDGEWSGNPNRFAGLSSGEGLISMVRDPSKPRCNKAGVLVIDDPGVEDKRLVLVQPEFAQVLEVLERQGNTLATKLRNAWDGKPLANNSLKSPLISTSAHISLIVHSTEDDLRDLMRRTMILNGFGNRFLWVSSRRSKSKPFGGRVPKSEHVALVERLSEAVAFARAMKSARMLFDKKASNLWASAYNTTLIYESENPITGRAMPQVRRLACIYALMDSSAQVKEVHLQAALAMWRYCAQSANFIFSNVHRLDPVADKVLTALRANKKGMTRKEVLTTVFSRNKSADEMTALRNDLVKHGKIRTAVEPSGEKGGRPGERWFIVG